MGGREEGSVGGGSQWEEVGSVMRVQAVQRVGQAVRRWVNGRRVGQMESGTVERKLACERRVLQWEEGEAMDQVVILLFHPPN